MSPKTATHAFLTLVFVGLCYTLSVIPTTKGWAEDPLLVPSLRSLALGEAMSAVTDDSDLIFYNPSGLALLEDSQLVLLGVRVNFNTDTVDTINEFSDAYNKAKEPKGEKNYRRIDHFPSDTLSELKEFDHLARIAGPIQVTYSRPGFALSLVNPEMLGRIDVVGSTIHFRGRGDVLGSMSYARRIYRNLSAGLTIKYLVRSEIGNNGIGRQLTEVLAANADMFIKRGLGYDIGLAYQLDRFPLTFGLALIDLANTTLTVEKRQIEDFSLIDEDESTIDQRFSIGISYRPDFKIPVKRLAYLPEDLLLALAFTSGDSFSERLHLGLEIKPYRWIAVRFGVHDGVRLGIGLRTARMAFDYMFAPSLKDPYLGQRIDNNHAFSWRLEY